MQHCGRNSLKTDISLSSLDGCGFLPLKDDRGLTLVRSPPKELLIERFPKVIRVCFGFTLLRSVIG